MSDIRTCAASLLEAGVCCNDACQEAATMATIDSDLIEHARCLRHTVGAVASKPLQWSGAWHQ